MNTHHLNTSCLLGFLLILCGVQQAFAFGHTPITPEDILADLNNPRTKNVIIDSDISGDMDDYLAIAYAMGSTKMNVIAVGAATVEDCPSDFKDQFLRELAFKKANIPDLPENNIERGMLVCYGNILHELEVTGQSGKIQALKGCKETYSNQQSTKLIESPQARNIVKLAKKAKEPLYILSLGAISNVASALQIDPSIKSKIVVVWLGANCMDWKTIGEFNINQDYMAAQMVINSGVPFVLLPAFGQDEKGSHVLTATNKDILSIQGDNPAGRYFREDLPRAFYGAPTEWQRIVWDAAAPGLLAHPEACELSIVTAPVFGDNKQFAYDASRHKIIIMGHIKRDIIIPDMLNCVSKLCTNGK